MTGRRPDGARPVIGRSEQVYSGILDPMASDHEPEFPMKDAWGALARIASVTVPPKEAAGDSPCSGTLKRLQLWYCKSQEQYASSGPRLAGAGEARECGISF
eukprot:502999-Pyramimonas_sp.AAC.1